MTGWKKINSLNLSQKSLNEKVRIDSSQESVVRQQSWSKGIGNGGAYKPPTQLEFDSSADPARIEFGQERGAT